MRKWILIFLLSILPISSAWAVGTCTVSDVSSTQIASQSNRLADATTVIVTLTCTADASAGTFPTTTVPITGSYPTQILNTYNLTGFYLYQVGQSPGATAPTANYTVTVKDSTNFALDLGLLTSNGSATAAQLTAMVNTTTAYPIVRSDLSVAITGNSVNSANIKIDLIFKTGVAKNGSGSGNTVSTSLTANTIPKSSGANSIVNSLWSDNGTSSSYTGAGGISAPSFTSNGTTNGELILTATGSFGTAPASNQASWASPGSYSTSARYLLPAAPPTNLVPSVWIGTNASGTVVDSFDPLAGSGSNIPTSGTLSTTAGDPVCVDGTSTMHTGGCNVVAPTRTAVTTANADQVWYPDIIGVDVALAAAKTAANASNTGQILRFIPNTTGSGIGTGSGAVQTTYTTNGMDLTTTSGACISLEGPGDSQLPGQQVILQYTGTAGNPMIQKTATKFNGGCFIKNLILDGNNLATDIRIDNAFRWNLENLVIEGMTSGGASPYDAALVIGPTTQTYEMKFNHITVQQKSNIASTWGSFTVTSSAGAITAYTINSGGHYYNNGIVAPIPVINGCSVLPSPLPTFTFTSNGDGTFAISGITGGLGGTCTGSVYMSAPELATGPNFGIDYFNMTDSTAIDTVVAGVGKVAGIQHNHGANTFISEHVYVGQPSAIQENATNKVYGLEADSMTSQAVNVFGHSAVYDGITTVFNNTENPSGYGKYAVVNFNTGEINNKFKGLTCSGTAGPNSAAYRSFGVMYGSGGGRLVNGDEIEYTNDCLNVNNIYTARTIGDHLYDGVNTFGFTYASAYASTSTLTVTGVPYTAGTATTNFPATYLNAGATAPTTFSTAGTMFGINTPSGFTGNLIDAHINGAASAFTLGANGNLATSGTVTGTTMNATANINATSGTITGQSVTATGVLSGASLSLSGNASPEITVASSMATSGSAFQYLATSLGTSTSLDFDFGATTATNDLVRMRFLHNAAGGGTTNQLTMGFASNLFFNLFASGDVSIGTATDNGKQLHTTSSAQFDGGILPSNTSATMTFFGKGVTASIGGSALTAGTCATGTATVSGATAGMTVMMPSPTDGTAINSLVIPSATVTAANTVTVQLCAVTAATPTAKQYNVTVIN